MDMVQSDYCINNCDIYVVCLGQLKRYVLDICFLFEVYN